MNRIFFALLVLLLNPLTVDAVSEKLDQASLNICNTAVGQAGKKSKFSKKDKKKLATCLKTVNEQMVLCLKKGKKVTLKEGGGSKESMIKILEAQKDTTMCNLDVTINAVKTYY